MKWLHGLLVLSLLMPFFSRAEEEEEPACRKVNIRVEKNIRTQLKEKAINIHEVWYWRHLEMEHASPEAKKDREWQALMKVASDTYEKMAFEFMREVARLHQKKQIDLKPAYGQSPEDFIGWIASDENFIVEKGKDFKVESVTYCNPPF